MMCLRPIYEAAPPSSHSVQTRIDDRAMSEILPRKLYLGSMHDAHDLAWLQATGVTLVLTVATLDPYDAAELADRLAGADIAHCVYDVVDTPEQDLLPFFPVWNRVIAEHLRADKGPVLVHCMAGISRSAAAVIAFLVAGQGGLRAALEHVTRQRPVVSPNDGFLAQLSHWEQQQRPSWKGCAVALYQRLVDALSNTHTRRT